MTITEKVAYLKGLMEGLDLDTQSKEGKILKAMAEVLDDMALSISDLEDGYSELCGQVDEIDEDLDMLEEAYYSDLDDDFEDEMDEDFEDDELYEVKCPTCGDTVYVDEEMLDEGEMNCPNCNELLEFDLDILDLEGCSCGDGGCGCGCSSKEEHKE